MKIAITGHTSGLGLALFNHFKNEHEVIGLSRSTGFDLTNQVDEVVEIGKTCDVFFNNAHVGLAQSVLIKRLFNHTRVITSGSMASAKIVNRGPYHNEKLMIEMMHIQCKRSSSQPMLLLKMGYLESFPDKNPVTYREVLNAIDFWFVNQRVSQIEFENIPRPMDRA